MAQAVKPTEAELQRREVAERLRGMFADVAPDRSLVDELIAERRAEAHAEDRTTQARSGHRGH